MPSFSEGQAPLGLRWHVGVDSSYRVYHIVTPGVSRANRRLLCNGERAFAAVQWSPTRTRGIQDRFRTRPYWNWDYYCTPCANAVQAILRGEETELSAVPPEGETQREGYRTGPSQWMGEELPEGVLWTEESFSVLGDTYTLGLSDGSAYSVSRRASAQLGPGFAECIRQAESVPADALRGRTRAALLGEFVNYGLARGVAGGRVVPDEARVSGSGYRRMESERNNRLWTSYTRDDTVAFDADAVRHALNAYLDSTR